MYLVSLYFDENTNQKIQSLIHQVANKTGNFYMTEGNVPPHITVCQFDTKQEKEAVRLLEKCVDTLQQLEVQFVSVGTFLPYVIYLAPVLGKELLHVSLNTYMDVAGKVATSTSQYYQPFQWMPHTTIGKTLSQEEMKKAFEVLQNQFAPFKGKITKIGLAKTNPYQDIAVFELKES